MAVRSAMVGDTMENRILFRAGLRRHRTGLLGVFALLLLVSLSLGTVLTLWTNAGRYVNAELDRAGFGTLTAWVSDVPDLNGLVGEIAALPEISRVETQEVIFSNYTVGEQESDSEGQLITLVPGETRYRFFTDDLSGYQTDIPQIAPGEVYVSPSLISMFGVELGSEILFPIARAGGNAAFTVKGFYEDPFMGSSMIGMKGFLICQEDHNALAELIQSSGIDALARDGAMLHLFSDRAMTTSTLNQAVNENTSLPAYTEFVHSAQAIAGFMLILQNAFSGLLIAFVIVLLAAVLVVLGHSIGSTIESDYRDMGILKTVGFTSSALRRLQLLQYSAAILTGMGLGLLLTAPVSRFVSDVTLATTGIRVPSRFPALWCVGTFAAILVLLAAFILWKTEKIGTISPMKAIRGETGSAGAAVRTAPAIEGTGLCLRLALRQLLTERRKYFSACAVAILLVFFASLVGRMDVWLGPDGKGMMDAFNPADHDLGVQTFGTLDEAEAEKLVLSFTGITDSYLLAMPSVAVNGVDYTANVIDQPERFHILEGRTCETDQEIVLTEFVAAHLGLGIGDSVTVSGSMGSGEFTITGLYSCANDMGDNVGMTAAGYLSIGRDDPQIWCHHYFLADPGQKAAITEALESTYGGDVHVHENTWPGLFGIISAMNALVVFLYVVVAVFILVVTVMTGSKILAVEQRDTGIYKAIGFTDRQLRVSFALRFGVTAAIGGAVGTILAAALTDPLVSSVMKLAGISNFVSALALSNTLLPSGAVIGLFLLFAYLAAEKIKRTDLTALISE